VILDRTFNIMTSIPLIDESQRESEEEQGEQLSKGEW
jgi:hypothetical protein